MTTPLEKLTQYVGPDGPESRKPCPPSGTGPNGTCTTCGGTGTVLDTEAPLFRALWVIREKWLVPGGGFPVANEESLVYIRRSRAEAALRLPGAIDEWSIDFTPPKHTRSGYWSCELDNGARTVGEKADNWLDALAAAVLVALQAQVREKP